MAGGEYRLPSVSYSNCCGCWWESDGRRIGRVLYKRRGRRGCCCCGRRRRRWWIRRLHSVDLTDDNVVVTRCMSICTDVLLVVLWFSGFSNKNLIWLSLYADNISSFFYPRWRSKDIVNVTVNSVKVCFHYLPSTPSIHILQKLCKKAFNLLQEKKLIVLLATITMTYLHHWLQWQRSWCMERKIRGEFRAWTF